MLNGNNVSSSQSIVSEFFSRNYPNGQRIVKGTTDYRSGAIAGRKTLTSQATENTSSLNNFFRNPLNLLGQKSKLIQSSYGNILTSGIETVYSQGASVSVRDQSDPEGQRVLTGSLASNQILLDAGATTNASLDYLGNDVALLSQLANASSDVATAGVTFGLNGEAYPHSNHTSVPNAGQVSAGSRMILLESTFGPGEKQWYLDRARVLQGISNSDGIAAFGSSSSLVNGFDFDIENGRQNINVHSTYVPGFSSANVDIPDEVINASMQKAYIAPVIIEFMIYMNSDNTDIFFTGNPGLQRAGNPDIQGSNLTPLEDGDTVSAHVMGRALDIGGVTNRDGTRGKLNFAQSGETVEVYRQALEIFLDELNTLGASRPDLIPDLIMIHDDLATIYGLNSSGLEDAATYVKQQYPNLLYVNFGTDGAHNNHIHISFAPQRSGVYVGPGGALGGAPSVSAANGGNTGVDGPYYADTIIAPSSTVFEVYGNSVYTKNYATTPSDTMTKEQIAKLLYATCMSLEAACIFVAVVTRESNLTPYVINPRGNDYSIGLWQQNMLAHGSKTYYVPINTNGSGGGMSQLGWKLAYKNWNSIGMTGSNFEAKLRGLDSAFSDSELKAAADPAVWIPLNQAYMLYTTITSRTAPQTFSIADKIATSPEAGYIFSPWGDYNNGPYYGWISNVSFKEAYDLFVSFGQPGYDLQQWVVDMFASPSGSASKSAQYANQWVNGWYFPSDLVNGSWVSGGEPYQRDVITTTVS